MADISGYLTNIKNAARGEDVRDSIISALKKINQDNPADVQPLNVTANGTYSGQGGIVYNPVTVNVPEGASQALSLSDLKVTENGEYTPEDGEAYRKIIVEVPQQVMEIMDVKTIYLEEGAKDYFAYDDGYDGYAQVSVVSGGGGGGGGATYTVNFMDVDGTTLLQAKTGVPFGGGAVYTGPQPTSSGMRFVGWSPNPLNVRSNMTCVPRFENITYDSTQILDDWVTIAKNVQTNPNSYSIGQWKILEIPEHRFNTRQGIIRVIPAAYYRMELIAKGVDQLEGQNGYANTTWLSRNIIPIEVSGWDDPANYYHPYPGDDNYFGWPHMPIFGGDNQIYSGRGYLQNAFTEAFPTDLLKYVKRVVKYSRVSTHDYLTLLDNVSTVDWFWYPSARELGCSSNCETAGAVYYTPEQVAADQTIRVCYDTINLNTQTDYGTRTVVHAQTYGPLFDCRYIRDNGSENTFRCQNGGVPDYKKFIFGFCL